jgi:hypothetical protein
MPVSDARSHPFFILARMHAAIARRQILEAAAEDKTMP